MGYYVKLAVSIHGLQVLSGEDVPEYVRKAIVQEMSNFLNEFYEVEVELLEHSGT